MKRLNLLIGLAVAGIGVGFTFSMTAPPDRIQGEFSKMLFVHVPSVWLAYLAFGVTLVGGIGWLITKKIGWDRLAGASAEVGVFFTGLGLATGMIWGRPVWGRWWDWGDMRLLLTAVMFFVYLGYLALRRSIADPRTRANRSAILGILAFVQIPIVHQSVTWWRTLHQPATVLRPETLESLDNVPMDPEMLRALMTNLAAFTLVYVAFTYGRTLLARLMDEEADLSEIDEIAGSVVGAPRIDDV